MAAFEATQNPEPTTEQMMNNDITRHLGPKTAANIAVLNAQIARGAAAFPTGYTITNTTDGTTHRISGVGTAAAFAPVDGGGKITSLAAAGDSLMVGAAPTASPYTQWTLQKSLAGLDRGNLAVPGNRTDQIAATLPALIALGARTVLLDGGVNDIIQLQTQTVSRAQVITNIKTLQAAGVDVIDVGLPPTNTPGLVPTYVQHEIWRRIWCMKNSVKHIDAWAPLATGAGGYTSGLNIDAVHWNTYGASLLVPQVDLAWKSSIAVPVSLLAMTDVATDAGTFLSNTISYVDTNADGVPDTWFSAGAGGTYSIQPADSGSFGKWFRCAITGQTNTGFNCTAVTLASLGWAIGDKLAVGFRVRTVDSSQALALTVSITGGSVSAPTPLFQYKGGATGSDITVYAEATITGGSAIGFQILGTGTGYFEMNRPIIVNLTQMGFA